ncbi:DUF2059 domain-containing protein [Yoonia sp. 2307UL14-13]|uniref:DUF2059 domain-containing protein n=1 Tax=Yoonia sp. 2307UL14-13 TaxID=3126506 RepID=UPI0030B7D555
MFQLRSLSFAGALCLLTLPSFAQTAGQDKVNALIDALRLTDILDVMRDEGLDYGEQIATDMFPGRDTARWSALVSEIYDVDVMYEEVAAALVEELDGDDVDQMIAFYTSEPGQTIVALEVSARAALLDEAVDAASKEDAAVAAADETPRFQLIEEFVETNDLVEANVVGALNANYAFFMGLMDGGAMPADMTPDMALQDVWAQEPQIRQNTEEWLYAYLLMAYQPLGDGDMETLIAFSRTEAGQDLNDALMVAFNGMFDDISRALGLASSRMMTSQDL